MKKMLMIGIDGGCWSVLEPAIEKGYMPHLASLRVNGSYGILKSTIPTITPAAWGSFQTGVSPAFNSVFDFCYFDRSTRTKNYVTSDMLQKTIWQFVSEAGGKVSAINVPMTYPTYPINGYMVSGITTPSEKCDFTFPVDFKQTILKAIPDYHIFTLKNIQKDFIHKDIEPFINELKHIIDQRTKLAVLTLRQQEHNLFMVHFQATDVLQHVLWPYLDSSHPLFSEQRFAYILREFYKQLDTNIKELCDEFAKNNGNDFMTMVVSDHGFETHECRVNLGNRLIEKGCLKINSHKVSTLKKITRTLRIGAMLKKIIGEDKTGSIESKMGLRKEFIDWEHTTAVSIGRSGEGYIYILEEDPAKKKELSDKLAADIYSIEHNGHKVADKIVTPEALYHTECSDIFPDLIIIPAAGYTFTGDVQAGSGLFDPVDVKKDFHIGKHHIDGIIVISGDNVNKGSISADITDVMPTVLSYLEIPFPKYVQGGIINAFGHIAEPQTYYSAPKHGGEAMNSVEDEDIEKRLTQLGYM